MAYNFVVLEYANELYAKNMGSAQSCAFVHPTMANLKRVVSRTLLTLFRGNKIPTEYLRWFTGVEHNVQDYHIIFGLLCLFRATIFWSGRVL